MTSRRLLSISVALALCLAIFTPSLFGQGSDLGAIRGTVTDSSGAVIPNAQVQITDVGTLKAYDYKTDGLGNYLAPNLVAGHYKATITAPGFSTSVLNGIVLAGSDVAESNAVLHPSDTASVVVSTEGGSINTENATVSETLRPAAVIDLPRNSRDILQFLYINPNITQGSEPGTFKYIAGQSYGASFSVDGQRSSGGVTGQATATEPSLDSVGEVNVLSNGFSAEYAGVANIRINTKRGGAQYHGSLFYNNVNSGLATWTDTDKSSQASFSPGPFAPAFKRSYFNITDGGGSYGGPVPKLKNTWFFMAYEHNWSLLPVVDANDQHMLGPDIIAGNFQQLAQNPANLPNIPAALVGSVPASDTVVYKGQPKFLQIPQNLINPITEKLITMYSPSLGSGTAINPNNGQVLNYSATLKGTNSQNLGDLRIDHDFNDNNRLSGVYHGSSQQSSASQTTAGAFVSAPYTGLGLLQYTRLNSTLSLSYTHVFSSHIVNEVRGGYNFQHYLIHANTTVQGFLQSIGFSSANVAAYGAVVGPSILPTYGNPSINFGDGIDSLSGGGRSGDRNENQSLVTFGDTFSWSIGRHMLKIGADFVRNQAIDGYAQSRNTPNGTMSYSGYGSNLNGFADFLLGMAPFKNQYVEQLRPAMDLHNWENAYYVQDDFRVNPRLTLNLGLRWDLYNPYIEKNDLLASFDPNYRNSVTGQIGRDVIPSAKALPYLPIGITANPPAGVGYVLAADSGLGIGRGLVRPDMQDFGPRIGAAFSLSSKSVVRGGFGLYYPTSSAHIYRDPLATNPFNPQVTTQSVAGKQISGWPTSGDATATVPIQGGSASGFEVFGNTPSVEYIPVNLKNPRLFQWNATYERQIPWQMTLRGSYIGGHQTGQIMGVDLDEIPASDIPFGTTTGDGKTPCDPTGDFNPGHSCNYSAADNARITFPQLGDFVTGFGNYGHSFTTSFQGQLARQARGFTFSIAYTWLDQKSSGVDNGGDTLAGEAYNPFQPNLDYQRDAYVSRDRVVAYGVYDLPFGRGQHIASNSSRFEDAFIGGWQLSTNMFAKTGTGMTPWWLCDDCDPDMPGNVASGATDAIGDFTTKTLRPNIIDNPYSGRAKGFQFNPSAFTVPDVGSTLFTNPLAARRNVLTGPSTWGANVGVHKSFRVNERIGLQLGADIANVFNHQMLLPDQSQIGGGGQFAKVGDFYLQVNQNPASVTPGHQPPLLPIHATPNDGTGLLNINPEFGKLNNSYSQEGVPANRQIRLRARITF